MSTEIKRLRKKIETARKADLKVKKALLSAESSEKAIHAKIKKAASIFSSSKKDFKLLD